MSRPRLRKYKNLPDNLSYDSTRGLYRYRNPITKKSTYLSRDKQACIQAAKKLNAHLMPASNDLLTKVTGGGHTWAMAITRYETDIAPTKEWSTKTRGQYKSYFGNLRACRLGAVAMADIEVIHVNAALDQLTQGKRMRNIYRHLMVQVFAYAINLGWCDHNPAEFTLKVSEKRQRMRLTMDAYTEIHSRAEPWLQVAMDMILVTLQRPEDLIEVRYSDIKDGKLHVQQRKSIRDGSARTKLRIHIGPELQAIIDASQDGKPCPYIIHRRPKRTRKSKKKKHIMQLTVDQLNKEFVAVRDATGLYQHATRPPPTYYEIKSLGGDRYRAMGWKESDIQALYGHEDKETTDHYLAGHEAPWEDVSAR